jgi:hypothetical protein
VRNKFNLNLYIGDILAQLGISAENLNHEFIYGKPKDDSRSPLSLKNAKFIFRKGLRRGRNYFINESSKDKSAK